MSGLFHLSRRMQFRAVTLLSTRPNLYFGLRQLTSRLDELCIRPDTDIVIEGFPRSANSTTVQKFLERQDRPLHVAHHKHHAAQILRAAEWGIPTVVLIRPPRAACMSLLALAAEARCRAGKRKAEGLAFADVFTAYAAFYEAVEQVLDQIVIGRFERVCNDIEGLVERVNARFGTTFKTQMRGAPPQAELGWHALPTDIREGIKRDLAARFEAEIAGSFSLRRLVARAEAVHARYGEVDERAG